MDPTASCPCLAEWCQGFICVFKWVCTSVCMCVSVQYGCGFWWDKTEHTVGACFSVCVWVCVGEYRCFCSLTTLSYPQQCSIFSNPFQASELCSNYVNPPPPPRVLILKDTLWLSLPNLKPSTSLPDVDITLNTTLPHFAGGGGRQKRRYDIKGFFLSLLTLQWFMMKDIITNIAPLWGG